MKGEGKRLKNMGATMKKLIERFGLYNVAAVSIMLTGIILFLITPLMLMVNIDTDIIGLIIFTTGLAMFILGFVIRPIVVKKKK